MIYFGYKHSKRRPTKVFRQDPGTNNKFGRQQENNAIVQHAVYEIILHDNKNVGVKDETHDNINYEVGEDEMYEIDKMNLYDKELLKHVFERELKYIYHITRHNGMICIHENEVDKIAECNLLHDILNPSKRAKVLNSH